MCFIPGHKWIVLRIEWCQIDFEENKSRYRCCNHERIILHASSVIVNLAWRRGHWEEAPRICAEAFRIAMKVLGQPSLCVSRMCGEVVSCSCWNCVYVNAFTRSPGQVSLPSRSGLACRRGLWKVIHLTFSRGQRAAAKPGWYTLRTAQRRAPSTCEPFPPHVSMLRPLLLDLWRKGGLTA